ncbi:hypothetical protein Nmel_014484 [Mimus melanotis]
MILLSCFLHLRPRRCGPLAGLGRGLGPTVGSRRALRVLVDMDGVLADFEGGFLKKFRARYPNKPYIALEDRRGFWVSEQYGRLGPELSEKAISIWESKNFFIELDPLPGAVEAVKQMANLADTDVFICTSPIKKYRYCPYEKVSRPKFQLPPHPRYPVKASKFIPLMNLLREISSLCGGQGFFHSTKKPLAPSISLPYAHQPSLAFQYAWVEKHFGPEFLEQIVLTRDKTVVSADLLIDDRPDITGAEQNPTWEHVLFTACHNKHLQLKPPSRRLHSWSDDWKAILDSKRLPPGQAT